MLNADHQVGRLVEAQGRGAVPYEEFIAFRSAFQQRLARLGAGVRAIAVGDLREMDELGPDVAPMVLGMLRSDNARIERSAHLVTKGSAFARQYEEIVGATRNPLRQVFFAADELLRWLGPELTPAELARLRAVLG